jgi:type VI secretion system protein ImpG
LWPLQVESASLGPVDSSLGLLPKTAVAVIRIELRCLGGVSFDQLTLDRLRFFLHGEGQLTCALYELLLNNVVEIRLRSVAGKDNSRLVTLPADAMLPIGFGKDEGLLPYGPRSFAGYRLLQEYFCFPEKFLFLDLTGIGRAVQAKLSDPLEILILLDRLPRLEQPVTRDTFRLGCAPIVNLFKQIAEPIRLSHAQTEYQVYPDIRRPNATEVYSIDSVVSVSPGLDETVEYEPFYSFKHAVEREKQQAFWYASRRPSPRKGDDGTEVYLSFVDLNFRPTVPASDTVVIHTTSSNRDLPAKLPFGGEYKDRPDREDAEKGRGDFELEGAAPLSRIRVLRKPTETLRMPLRRGTQWRIISHLGLNYLSLCDGGREALQEILKIYDFADSSSVRQQINGIINLSSKQVVGRPRSMPWNGFCRGLEVTIELDEQRFVGSGVFLFASVLEKFLGLYTSLNSFTQLIVRTRQREEPLKRWPPRAGEQILL